jgi:hypothetical protein
VALKDNSIHCEKNIQRASGEGVRMNRERYVTWKVRKAVLERDKACVYCDLPVARVVGEGALGGPNSCWRAYDKRGRPFHFDHKIPVSQGGASDESNVQLACANCNLKKGRGELPKHLIPMFDPRQGRLPLVFEVEVEA